MIIDGHIRLGDSFNKQSGSVEEYLKLMGICQIDKAIICPNKPISYRVEDGNEYIAQLIQRYKNKFIGAIRLDPWRPAEMKEEINKYKENLHIKFVYLNPWEEQYRCNSKECKNMVEEIVPEKYKIIIETGYPWTSHITQVVDLAIAFPNKKFLLTNAGQLDLSASTLDDVALAMERTENLFLGTASACGAEWLSNIYKKYPKRIFFESNFPMMEPYLEKFRISSGFFTKKQQENILGYNINELI